LKYDSQIESSTIFALQNMRITMTDSISRFTRTVENYVKYRPSYPFAIVEFLQQACQLTNTAVIADVASGTGFLAEIFLKNGNPVIGIEPNADMRAAGQHFLRNYPRFTSVSATAEATTLESHSVDMITAGQAFHWFDPEKSRQEFARILKPDGWVILAWNIARNKTPFMAAYEKIWLNYLAPPATSIETDRQAIEAKLQRWYAPGILNFESFDNSQVVDYAGLRGRVLSSSYSPAPEHPRYTSMLTELETIFHTHQAQGKVTIEYECRVCHGQLH
jgi:SAM-dependent methyltransferase